jgi:hypothetical protein
MLGGEWIAELVAVLPLEAASTSAASSSATVGEMEGAEFFLLVPRELERRRMKRVARLLLGWPGLDGPELPETDFLSPEPLLLLGSVSDSTSTARGVGTGAETAGAL